MAAPNTIVVKDKATIRADILRTISNGLIQQGVDTPNVGPSSDFYNLADALANELTVVGANNIVANDDQMPDTAIDDGLIRICQPFGIEPQPAAGSYGPVVIEASATAPIPTGARLTDEQGQIFEVITGGNYADGDEVQIRAVSTGESTNHDEDDVLQWVAAPPFCSDKVTVGDGGLVNGADADDNESMRARLYAHLQAPPGSGDWQDVCEAGEKASGSVQKGFAYPAVQGPSTADLVTVAAPTDTNKSRELDGTLMTGTIAPYAQGALPRFGQLTVTTVVDVDADVAFALSLPEAPTANPPGPGGGWVNGTPWPTPDGASSWRCAVTAVTSNKVFTVDATTAPTDGVSRIAWLSPYDWKLYTATVIAHSGTSGAYVITLDQPFVDVAVGCYVWPECQNAALYVATVLASFALMGPGEKTDNASALVRGFRHPPPALGWPYSLGPHLLNALTKAHSEVNAAQFYHRTDGTTTVTGSSGTVTPEPPAAIADAPNIFVPRHIGFYRVAS